LRSAEGSIDVDKRSDIDRQRNAGNEICLVGMPLRKSTIANESFPREDSGDARGRMVGGS
jgi:hypothetical protein